MKQSATLHTKSAKFNKQSVTYSIYTECEIIKHIVTFSRYKQVRIITYYKNTLVINKERD